MGDDGGDRPVRDPQRLALLPRRRRHLLLDDHLEPRASPRSRDGDLVRSARRAVAARARRRSKHARRPTGRDRVPGAPAGAGRGPRDVRPRRPDRGPPVRLPRRRRMDPRAADRALVLQPERLLVSPQDPGSRPPERPGAHHHRGLLVDDPGAPGDVPGGARARRPPVGRRRPRRPRDRDADRGQAVEQLLRGRAAPRLRRLQALARRPRVRRGPRSRADHARDLEEDRARLHPGCLTAGRCGRVCRRCPSEPVGAQSLLPVRLGHVHEQHARSSGGGQGLLAPRVAHDRRARRPDPPGARSRHHGRRLVPQLFAVQGRRRRPVVGRLDVLLPARDAGLPGLRPDRRLDRVPRAGREETPNGCRRPGAPDPPRSRRRARAPGLPARVRLDGNGVVSRPRRPQPRRQRPRPGLDGSRARRPRDTRRREVVVAARRLAPHASTTRSSARAGSGAWSAPRGHETASSTRRRPGTRAGPGTSTAGRQPASSSTGSGSSPVGKATWRAPTS